MPNLNVTYEEMTDAANRLTNGKMQLEHILSDLSSMINNLVASGFQTELASGAFNQTYEDFTAGTTKAIGGLDGLALFLTKASTAMQTTDSELARALNQ
jgi:WXG100 family type VII secretion target